MGKPFGCRTFLAQSCVKYYTHHTPLDFFSFDHVFDETDAQGDIYQEACLDMVDLCLEALIHPYHPVLAITIPLVY